MRRIVSVWLPHLSTDRLARRRGAPVEPLAMVTAAQGGLRIAGVDAVARAAGIATGMAAADARALCPSLRTAPAAPEADMAALTALADWCRRWSPWTAVESLGADGSGGLWLDVSGCAHLFGGEPAMVEAMVDALGRLGFRALLGLADSPGAAWAAARFLCRDGAGTAIVPEGAARQWLSGLPPAALRLPPATMASLDRLGLRSIGDLLGLPRGPLAGRFGPELALRLDQLLGRAPEPISPRREAEPYEERLSFAEPIGRTESIVAALRRMLDALCKRLERDRHGARRLELVLFRVDGGVERLVLGTAHPARDPTHLARLFGERLDKLDGGFGIEAMLLSALVVEFLAADQRHLTERHGVAGDGLAMLIDRLANRLGRERIFRPAAHASHLPERAVRAVTPLGPYRGGGWPVGERPARLLPHPEAVEAGPGDPPASFRWRGRRLRVAHAEGPERLAAEWWHAATPAPPTAIRDYWRIEDEDGRRYWLFREGRRGRWYVQGLFA